MATWREIEDEAPELMAAVQACFAVRKHCTIATLRRDGAPRISGIETAFEEGELRFGSMPGAVKAWDLARDPRFALHSPTVDPPEPDPTRWPGEAKLSGRVRELLHKGTSHLWSPDIEEVVLTRVAADGEALEISSWHPGRGLEVRRR